jgi:tetratricopeptide (TPR) repeat protein
MQGRIDKLEKALLEGKKIDLAEGALLASGVNTKNDFNRYLTVIDLLCQRIAQAVKGDDVERAREIFDWLWRVKPHRHEYRGNFRLSDALEAQLGEQERVGNCLGLTVLYHVLAQRFGLQVKAVHLEDAFGIGPHVFSVLYVRGDSIDIENILPHGFDFQGHLGNPQREEWSDRELIADIYHSAANDFFEQGKWEGAIENYDKAIGFNPKYTKARLNKGIALVALGRTEEAREWFR